jgi:hypothetical protein
MADDFLAGSGRMEGGGYYTAHSEAQEAYGELGFEWLEQAAADGTLALRRHAARSLPDTYFAAYSADHDLDRYVTSVVDFFRAAFAESLWAALDRNRDASQVRRSLRASTSCFGSGLPRTPKGPHAAGTPLSSTSSAFEHSRRVAAWPALPAAPAPPTTGRLRARGLRAGDRCRRLARRRRLTNRRARRDSNPRPSVP